VRAVQWLFGLVLGVGAGYLFGNLMRADNLGSVLKTLRPGAGGEQSGGPAGGKAPRGLLLDEQLARAARARLQEAGLASARVDVTVVDGAAYLRGRVADADESTRIADFVAATPGLERVVNELKVPESTAS
jgi:hypothetical protein